MRVAGACGALGRAILAEESLTYQRLGDKYRGSVRAALPLNRRVLVGVEGRGEAFFCGAFVKMEDLGGALEQVAW